MQAAARRFKEARRATKACLAEIATVYHLIGVFDLADNSALLRAPGHPKAVEYLRAQFPTFLQDGAAFTPHEKVEARRWLEERSDALFVTLNGIPSVAQAREEFVDIFWSRITESDPEEEARIRMARPFLLWWAASHP
jgi:hypothetical protein